MKCQYRHCDKEVTNSARKYCDNSCLYTERNRRVQEKQLQVMKKKARTPNPEGKECKYCMDSNHTTFCCEYHEREYNFIMTPIDIALGR